ncbi:DNA-binding MarR family transcriptional regulator [Herbihabitans rhizosphaerae]|uniref:DNA-binding MarR family transcriptional regulator n=1 Tax=Herbihabitans rhizosphaerae TaxID=1872711 RepID=A0A4Q7KYD5_9PSEU|nr:MarR family transcriptional regulator [Herbihabitans rhizosphaerae]RZS41061.1 DNA-binding MarR family transcriptional regulator [Herbihabitans rhizosphaerae]
MAETDSVDEHVTRWREIIDDLDPTVEAVVTRMQWLVAHLRKNKERALTTHELQLFEYQTLHSLAGFDGRASAGELAAALRVAPATMTGRLDTLEERGFVTRGHSSTDRRRVDVELTPAGRARWRGALDAQGREEHRVMAPLTQRERERLADLLRRMLLLAEHTE